MSKATSYLSCLVAPLASRNILFLAKQRRARIAVPLLRAHLWIFYRISLTDIAAQQGYRQRKSPVGLGENIVKALGCLGFLSFCSQELGVLKSDDEIRKQAADDSKYSSGSATVDEKLIGVIGGRSVAIVGPSRGRENQAEIDSFDVVIRIGYSGPESLPANTGQRCDASFYAIHKIESMVESGSYESLRGLKLAVLLPGKERDYYHEMLLKGGISPGSIAMAVAPQFSISSANALVATLYNCVLCRPNRIKVFNADLFLSKAYPSGYIANKRTVRNQGSWSYEEKGMCKSFSLNHNPAEQLELYKHYYFRKEVEVDARLAEILEMSIDDYVLQIDQLYGLPLRAQLGLL